MWNRGKTGSGDTYPEGTLAALSCVVTNHKEATNRLGIRKTLRHGGQKEEIQEYDGAPTRFVR